MKTNPRLLAVLLSGLAACQTAHDASEAPVAEAAAAMTTSCGATRWIGLTSSCAGLTNWSAAQLFPGATSPLDAYCVYTWTGALPPTAADTTLLATSSGAFELAEDCPVVVPQSPYDDLLASSLRSSLHAQVGTASALGVNPKGKTPVRVIVVDTAPGSGESGDIHMGNDRHGDTLASLIRDIGTGPQGAIEVASSLGLPWLDESTWSEGGGHVGRLSDLALGIYHGMEIAAAEGRDHVIVNLSVGWENLPGLAECNDTGPSTAPSHAVYDVMQRARCSGAIVIAAAGNDAGGAAPPTGMVCPARWEGLSVQACDEHDEGPMVRAVGGVDYADRPIALTRPLGRPRLAATSLGGVGWAGASPVPAPLHGTSVATAVASGVAAVVWSQRPSMSGAAVMDALYTSGVHAGLADACAGASSGSCGDARRVSLCAALDYVGVGVNCSAPPAGALSTPPLSPQVLAAAQQAFPAPSGGAIAAPVSLTDLPRYTEGAASLSGGVFPQPVVPVCPSCVYVFTPPGSIFYANLSVDVREPTLVVETSNSTLGVPLTASTDLAAGSYAIPVSAAPSGVTRAWITGYNDGSTAVSVTQEVLVTP